jgi:hypothetical protein|tara:strand:- start:11440 stop:12114 length:675 start_codon:yes stop_codon:yes gene_type:complete
MKNRELVSRISNQVRMITKDDYISDRFVLSVALTIAEKFITQKIQRRSIDRESFLYREVNCIEFEPENVFTCNYVEFKSCDKLSKSVKSIKDLKIVFTSYGSSIKELYSIDRQSTSFNESTLYQLRMDSRREGNEAREGKFYVLNNHIYVPREIEALSGVILALDQYELDEMSSCEENCESAWDKDFICPSSMLEDVIGYAIQNIVQTKQIPEDEKPDLNNNSK